MKKLQMLMIFLFLIGTGLVFGIDRVNADRIIDQINNGKDVYYKDAEIIGDLDLTSIDEITQDNPKKRSRWSTKVYSCHVKTSLSFINCVFQGKVLGYVHYNRKNKTYNAVFYKDVDFQGCEFKDDSAFKYAKFQKKANFKNTKYHKEALFKYTKFSTPVSFSNAGFFGSANFKYTPFPQIVDFDNAVFHRYANFKYTKFPSGVSFKNTKFKRDANFKYVKFKKPVNFDGIVFEDDVNLKYTKIEGKSFKRYLRDKK